MEWLLGIVLVVGAFIFIAYHLDEKRRERLMDKYADPRLVERLMNREIWQGQTEEQLLDSQGKPAKIDQAVLKTKTRETWKYEEIAKNRYALKVILENGDVIGWDKK